NSRPKWRRERLVDERRDGWNGNDGHATKQRLDRLERAGRLVVSGGGPIASTVRSLRGKAARGSGVCQTRWCAGERHSGGLGFRFWKLRLPERLGRSSPKGRASPFAGVDRRFGRSGPSPFPALRNRETRQKQPLL